MARQKDDTVPLDSWLEKDPEAEGQVRFAMQNVKGTLLAEILGSATGETAQSLGNLAAGTSQGKTPDR